MPQLDDNTTLRAQQPRAPEGSLAQHVLAGVTDLHVHTGPDIFPRRVTSIEAARAAQDAGMAALLLKSHSTDTAARAELVRVVTGFTVFGGVVLNYPVGGLNPHAVVETARQGGRCVWMPTIGARNFMARAHMAPMLQAAVPPGVRGLVACHRGRLLPDVERILDVVAEHDLMLAGGHLGAEDMATVFEEARARGIRRLAVNHAEAEFMNLSASEVVALAKLGAFVEITKMGPVADRAALIREVGVEHCYLATDGGPLADPPPVELMHNTITGLRELGFTPEEVKHLSVDVPAYLLGLDKSAGRPELTSVVNASSA
jgi:Family of unknown function (DUF6282)